MATFGEKTFTFSEIPKFYRIPVSCSKDECYLNVGKNSIVKVHDQKPLHTWTLTHPNYFTSPVVYSNETLYCVINKNTFMKWCVDEDNLKNAEKIKFQEPIFAVIPVDGEQPIILLKSGKCAVIDVTDFKTFELVDLKENEELVWAESLATAADILVFCLVHNEKDKEYSMYSFTIQKNEKTAAHLCSYSIIPETAVLKSWCLNHHDSSFLYVWSDGRVCLHTVKDTKGSNLISLKDITTNTDLAISCIDSTHIAVVIGNSNQKECTLEIWDTKFSVLKARKVLKIPNLDNLQIATENSNIFLYFNKEIISIPFQVEHSTLAAAVGKLISETKETLEFSWDAKEGQLLKISSTIKPESMDTSDGQQDSLDSVEVMAQRLLNQNLQYLPYIPESDLTKLLQLAIRYKKEGNTSNAACVILNAVFSASFNDIFLLKYLKRIDLDEVLVALELLLSFLNQTINMPSTVTQRPSDLQIVNWAGLIIQSHMESLLFSKDKNSKKLLRKLEKTLCTKMEEYEDYEGIQNYFLILQKKNVLPEKSSVVKYCIETLDI